MLGKVGEEDTKNDQARGSLLANVRETVDVKAHYTERMGWKMPGEASSRQCGVRGSMG